MPPPGAAAPDGCPHPYFPLEQGLRLTYQVGHSSELSLLTREVRRVPEGLSGTLEVDVGGKGGTSVVTCGPEGVSTGAGGLEGALLSASGMNVEVVAAQGLLVPAPALLVPGGSWKNSLSVKIRPPSSAKLPGGLRFVIASTFEKEATVVGEEELLLAAGTFKALKVKHLTTARATRGGSGPGRTLESFVWFVPGVGIARISTGEHTDLELVRIERPTPPPGPAAPGVEKASATRGER